MWSVFQVSLMSAPELNENWKFKTNYDHDGQMDIVPPRAPVGAKKFSDT